MFDKMRWIADEVVVGIHDDESIYVNKKVYTAETYEVRAQKVAEVVDVVFLVDHHDPSDALEEVVKDYFARGYDICYVRANDWPHFPGRGVVEKHEIPIFLVPYTSGISSSMLREQLTKKSEV